MPLYFRLTTNNIGRASRIKQKQCKKEKNWKRVHCRVVVINNIISITTVPISNALSVCPRDDDNDNHDDWIKSSSFHFGENSFHLLSTYFEFTSAIFYLNWSLIQLLWVLLPLNKISFSQARVFSITSASTLGVNAEFCGGQIEAEKQRAKKRTRKRVNMHTKKRLEK